MFTPGVTGPKVDQTHNTAEVAAAHAKARFPVYFNCIQGFSVVAQSVNLYLYRLLYAKTPLFCKIDESLSSASLSYPRTTILAYVSCTCEDLFFYCISFYF